MEAPKPDSNQNKTSDSQNKVEAHNLGMNMYRFEKFSNYENPGEDCQQFLQKMIQIGKDYIQMDKSEQEKFENQAKSVFQPDEKTFKLPEFKENIELPSFTYGAIPKPQAEKINSGNFGWNKKCIRHSFSINFI